MRKFSRMRQIAPLAVILLACGFASAQTEEVVVDTIEVEPTVTSNRDRLFIDFIEDAMIPEEQWWEGYLQYDDADQITRTILFGRFAFQVWENTEIGVNVGFGGTDIDGGMQDGNGATDMDLWGKYYWNLGNDRTEVTAGAILTVPTGDNSVGLGFDAWALKGFGALRWRLNPVILIGNIGLQLNEDGRTLDETPIDGETAVSAGVGVIAPWSDAFSFVGELTWQSNRFDGLDDDSQLLAGLNLRLTGRSLLRPALALGLQDGAPDWQLFVSYTYTF